MRTLVPTRDAAIALGVGEDAVLRYSRGGRLTRYGTVRRALFDLAEIAILHRQIWPCEIEQRAS